jgi:hypothetical protein
MSVFEPLAAVGKKFNLAIFQKKADNQARERKAGRQAKGTHIAARLGLAGL